ncbi:hypothetical protein VNO78_26287 [Psophocarpus tetragonolobus]|uniref:PB1-like domain-containing protein n=1 Tax=Psophocarpus tetragonolobus TaxID=3891 RepID=A0AAN9S026_PSOTE
MRILTFRCGTVGHNLEGDVSCKVSGSGDIDLIWVFRKMRVDLVFHYMSCFVKDPELRYDGLSIDVAKNIDLDRWSYLKALSIVRDLGYKEEVQVWWNTSSMSFSEGTFDLLNDNDVFHILDYALKNDVLVKRICGAQGVSLGANVEDDVGATEVSVGVVQKEFLLGWCKRSFYKATWVTE